MEKQIEVVALPGLWSLLFLKVLGLYTYMNFTDIPVFLCRAQYGVGPPFAAKLLGSLSTNFRSVSLEMFDHSSRGAFVRSGTEVGREGLAPSLLYNSSQLYSQGSCAD